MNKVYVLLILICVVITGCNSYRNTSVFEAIDEKNGLLSKSDTTLNLMYQYIEDRREILNQMPVHMKMKFNDVTYGDLCQVFEAISSPKIQKQWHSLYSMYETQLDSVTHVYAERREQLLLQLNDPSFSIGSRLYFYQKNGRHADSDDEIVRWTIPFGPFDDPSYVSMFKKDDYIKKYVSNDYKSQYEYAIEQCGLAGKLIVALDEMWRERNDIRHDIQVPLPATDDTHIPEEYLK